MLEEGLNCLPSYKRTVVTPTGESWDLHRRTTSFSLSLSHTHTVCPGQEYEGEWFEKLNCAVSILRSGVCVLEYSSYHIEAYIELELPQQYAFKLFASILHNCVCVCARVCVCVCQVKLWRRDCVSVAVPCGLERSSYAETRTPNYQE